VTALMLSLVSLVLIVVFVKVFPLESIKDEEIREYYIMGVAAILIFIAAILAEITRTPTAILETLFGVFASLLGLEPTQMLLILGEIGGIVLMFVAGTEVEMHILRRYWRQSSLIGILSFFIPFIVSLIGLKLIGVDLYPGLYVAVALSTTSVSIVYSALKPGGLLASRRGQAIFASAMVVDIISIIVLSVLVVEFSMLVIAYLLALIVLPLFSIYIIPRLPVGYSETSIRLIMALLLSMALFSRIVGIHAVLFSFIVGMTVARIIRSRGRLDDKVKGLTFGFLAPFFFFVAGLRVSISDPTAFIILIPLMLVFSYIPKVVATYVAISKLLGIRSMRASSIFGARLTVSIISATIGLTAGMITPEIYGAITFTAILTIIITGVIAGRGLRTLLLGEEI